MKPQKRNSLSFNSPGMGKKRKHSETQCAEPPKKDEGAPERPNRTLSGWKDKEEADEQTESKTDSSPVFRNKEKVMAFHVEYCFTFARLSQGVEKCRKHQDLYMWMAKSPNGPSVKFLVNAVHTMEELKLTGNHLKGSRP
ncbi:hypothetical protein V6N13_013115 [Hibiscus sabdariffa]|uniref:Brix domain-containing protein n=1 Tax=Hibiscus sabdariffa TaxID=183260 RepID=A0ABR2SHG0_9ROSI